MSGRRPFRFPRRRATASQVVNMEGLRIGVVTVGGRTANVGHNAAWICTCTKCGKEFVCAGSSLRRLAETKGYAEGCSTCRPRRAPRRFLGAAGMPGRPRPRVCEVCWDLPWHRAAPVCTWCKRPHAEEPPNREPLRTSSPMARAMEGAW
jgi:hypothetical protein